MKKVFRNKTSIAEIFVLQSQNFAGTPKVNIEGIGKGRRFYFKKDTCYSYRDSYPLAKMKNGVLWIRENIYVSQTTKVHRQYLLNAARLFKKQIISSENLKTINMLDDRISKFLKKAMSAKMHGIGFARHAHEISNLDEKLITKSEFPLLFDEKHNKLKLMFLSRDKETFNLARKIIKKQKLI